MPRPDAPYLSKYFVCQEFVDPVTFKERGDRAWQLIDERLVRSADQLREKFGPVTINDWYRPTPGSYKESGFRRPESTTGAKYSQHRYGRGADLKFSDCTPETVFKYILQHDDEFPFITCLEDVAFTPTWLHVDVRYTRHPSNIIVVKP